MTHAEIVALLTAAPAGKVRVFRVDCRDTTPRTWGELPCPQNDEVPPPPFWSAAGWKCGACLEYLHRWWPEHDLRYNIMNGAKPSILEVPADACWNCGTQYVFDPAKAVEVLQ